ncbi:hypothetical protein Esti_002529 [Eimeria stiedai]
MEQGSHQVRMAPEDRYKTAFRTFMGHFEWRVIPFALKGALTTFQAIMNLYLLLHVGGGSVDLYGGCTGLCCHIRGASWLARRPLQQLMKQKASFQWTAAHSSAVQVLKDGLIHYTKLSLPDLTKPFILRTDASGVAIGGLLEQDAKPLSFLSERLSAEMHYSTYDQGQLAVVRALERWRHFLIAAEHLDIVYQTTATNVVAHAPSRCPGYKQDPQHASSKVLSVSSLSPTAPQQSCICASNPAESAVQASLLLARAQVRRRPTLQNESNSNRGPSHKAPSPLLHDNVQAPSQSFLSDPDIQGVGDEAWEAALQRCSEFGAAYKRAKETQPTPALIPDLGRVKLVGSVMCIQLQGLWHICVPHLPSFRQCILYQHHDVPTAGHLGTSKTFNQIAMKFHWKAIRDDDGCDILTLVDSLSKVPHFIPTTSSSCTADFVFLFADRVVRYHGFSSTIGSDRGPRFIPEFWRLFCRHCGIKRALLSAWHPQTDRQTERLNRTIEQMLHTYIQSGEKEWPDLLPALELAYNCTSHSATRLSPLEAMLGENPKRHIGPYRIFEQIGPAACKLQLPLPPSMPFDPVFHVSLLSAHRSRPPDMASPLKWEPVGQSSDGLPIYEAESILDQQGEGGAARYLVRWKGFPD